MLIGKTAQSELGLVSYSAHALQTKSYQKTPPKQKTHKKPLNHTGC